MGEGNQSKNYLLWIALAALACLCVVMMRKYNETKEQVDQLIVKSDSIALAGQMQMEAMAAQEEESIDPMLELPVEKLSVKLDKGPSCMVANTFETYYARNVIDGNRGTAWGRESYQGSKGSFVFNLPCRRLDHIDIWNGKWGEMGAWGDNARVKEMTISKRNKIGEVMELGTFTLENRHEVQTIYFDFYAEEARDIETLTITVSGKFGGELFQDLYLSELEFFGSK